MTEFIFMLTQQDVTVPNAVEIFKEIKSTGLTLIGFKDVGLPKAELMKLVKLMKKEKMKTFIEVVSGSEQENLRSAKTAVELGVDYLIGGTYAKQTLPVVKGTGIKYFPYIGKIIGHPCLLRGTIEEIVEEGRKIEKLGVDGINLLAYRYDGDVIRLIKSVRMAVNIPIIVAGSINSFERVREMTKLDVWAFTIGAAILEKKFVPNGTLSDQIRSVLRETQRRT